MTPDIKVTFVEITNWLTMLGFRLIAQSTPPTGTKTFSFSKKDTKVVVFFTEEGSIYCKLNTHVYGYGRFQSFIVTSLEFSPLDTTTLNKVFEEHQNIKKEMEAPIKKIKPAMVYWEIWLYSAIFLFIVTLVIGLLPGSKEKFPNWPYYMALTIVNTIVCIAVGKSQRY